jgi:hypothetical protein
MNIQHIHLSNSSILGPKIRKNGLPVAAAGRDGRGAAFFGAAPNRWEVPSSLQAGVLGSTLPWNASESLRAMNHGNGNGDVGCRTVGWEARMCCSAGFFPATLSHSLTKARGPSSWCLRSSCDNWVEMGMAMTALPGPLPDVRAYTAVIRGHGSASAWIQGWMGHGTLGLRWTW